MAEYPASPELPKDLLGEVVVVDTDSSYLYLGRLEGSDGEFLRLSAVDVHDAAHAGLSKEGYVHEARGIGVRQNRACTYVRLARVVSLSRLKDVQHF